MESVRDVARREGVHISTVTRWAERGLIEARKVRGRWLISGDPNPAPRKKA